MALFVRHFANYDKTQLDLSKEEDYRLLENIFNIFYLYVLYFVSTPTGE